MNKSQKQDSMKEMIELLQEDYSAPTKLWIWGKVIKEWTGLIIGGFVFSFVFLYLVFSINGPGSNVQYKNGSQQPVVLPMKDIVKFMAICQRSINERQEILESLMETIRLYAGKKLDQKSAELKLSSVSSISKTCNIARGMAIDEIARIRNPFDIPEISAAFNKLIEDHNDFFKKNNEVLDFQQENKQWEALCTLCQSEVKKANQELAHILNPEASTEKTNFFN